MLSCPAVIGAKPPQVNPIFFLIISTNSLPDLRRNLPDLVRPNTTDLSPSLLPNKASPIAVSTPTLDVTPG